jgi:hypothetical protein
MFVGIGTVCLVIDLVQELVQLGIFRVVIHSVGYMSIQFYCSLGLVPTGT